MICKYLQTILYHLGWLNKGIEKECTNIYVDKIFCAIFMLLKQGGGGRCCFQMFDLEPWELCWAESEMPGVAAILSADTYWIAGQGGVNALFMAVERRAVPQLSVILHLPKYGNFLSGRYWGEARVKIRSHCWEEEDERSRFCFWVSNSLVWFGVC